MFYVFYSLTVKRKKYNINSIRFFCIIEYQGNNCFLEIKLGVLTKKAANYVFTAFLFCDPGGIRTHDPQLRRLLLYPAELQDHFTFF